MKIFLANKNVSFTEWKNFFVKLCYFSATIAHGRAVNDPSCQNTNHDPKLGSWLVYDDLIEHAGLAGQPLEVGHVPNCVMVEVINQSGACIFLQVDLEGMVSRGMKRISWGSFLGIHGLSDPVA